MMVRVIVENESDLYPMGVDEETLELVPIDKATLFFSRGEAERFVLSSRRKANDYQSHLSKIENDNSKKIVEAFIKDSTKGSFIGALLNGSKISYICG